MTVGCKRSYIIILYRGKGLNETKTGFSRLKTREIDPLITAADWRASSSSTIARTMTDPAGPMQMSRRRRRTGVDHTRWSSPLVIASAPSKGPPDDVTDNDYDASLLYFVFLSLYIYIYYIRVHRISFLLLLQRNIVIPWYVREEAIYQSYTATTVPTVTTLLILC